MKNDIRNAGDYIAHMIAPARNVIAQIQEYTLIKLLLAGAIMSCQRFIDQHLQAVMIMLTLVVLDQITGVVAAIKNHEFTSSRFRAGIIKLFMYVVLVVAFHLIGEIISPLENIALDKLAVLYLAATEAFSIAENVQRITGVPLPVWMRELLKSFGKKRKKFPTGKDDEKGDV